MAVGTTDSDPFSVIKFSESFTKFTIFSLAYSEIYLVLAEIFTHFDFNVVHETNEKDVACAMDAFVPAPIESSQGVRVRVSHHCADTGGD